MINYTDVSFSINIQEYQGFLHFKPIDVDNSIGSHKPARSCAHSILNETVNGIIVHQFDIAEVQTGEIIRVHDPAYATDLSPRNQEVMMLFWDISLHIITRNLRVKCKGVDFFHCVKAVEIQLRVVTVNKAVQTYGEWNPLRDSFEKAWKFRIKSLEYSLSLTSKLDDFLHSLIVSTHNGDSLWRAAVIPLLISAVNV